MGVLARVFGFGPVDIPTLPTLPPVRIPAFPNLPAPPSADFYAAPKASGDVRWFVSQAGLWFVIRHEGLRLKAYYDSAKIPTIGYGSTVVDGTVVTMGMTITTEKAQECLRLDCNRFVYALQHLITVDLNQNQIDSLTDFCYNVGSSAFASSSLRRAINNKQPIAANLFTRWNKIHEPVTKRLVEVPGLTHRRNEEYQLYTS